MSFWDNIPTVGMAMTREKCSPEMGVRNMSRIAMTREPQGVTEPEMVMTREIHAPEVQKVSLPKETAREKNEPSIESEEMPGADFKPVVVDRNGVLEKEVSRAMVREKMAPTLEPGEARDADKCGTIEDNHPLSGATMRRETSETDEDGYMKVNREIPLKREISLESTVSVGELPKELIYEDGYVDMIAMTRETPEDYMCAMTRSVSDESIDNTPLYMAMTRDTPEPEDVMCAMTRSVSDESIYAAMTRATPEDTISVVSEEPVECPMLRQLSEESIICEEIPLQYMAMARDLYEDYMAEHVVKQEMTRRPRSEVSEESCVAINVLPMESEESGFEPFADVEKSAMVREPVDHWQPTLVAHEELQAVDTARESRAGNPDALKRMAVTRSKPKKFVSAMAAVRDSGEFDQHGSKMVKRRRKPGEMAPIFRMILCVLSIGTYLGIFVLDGLLLKGYITRSKWAWFGITLVFILLPLITILILSLKWAHDDKVKHNMVLPWKTVILHCLLLGPVERCCYIFAYGLKTRTKSKLPFSKGEESTTSLITISRSDANLLDKEERTKSHYYEKYLAEWRDVSMLRFIHSFLETGPQVTIQLYILFSDYEHSMAELFQNDYITVIKVLVTLGSLSLGMVSYNSDLREYAKGKKLNILQFILLLVYRLLIITSRVVAIVLFTSRFKYPVIGVLIFHWLVMIYLVRRDKTHLFTNKKGKYNDCFELFFQILMGFIFIFAFITTAKGSTRKTQTFYYLLFIAENILMMIAWVLKGDKKLDVYEIVAIAVVVGTFLLGIAIMLLYYRQFHPSHQKTPQVNDDDECGLLVVASEHNVKVT